jgi:L-asparaginase
MSILLLHGGAGKARNEETRAAIQAALGEVAAAAFATLQESGALLGVVEATRLLEDNPLFNAGLGSKLQADGVARLSASLCEGTTHRFSGVINAEGLPNPILLCHHLLEERDRVLSGPGAVQRAQDLGLPLGDVRTDAAIRTWKAALDGETGTVGAVALDGAGFLCAASSTGGRGMERVGRVSDSCTIAGNHANNHCAATTTGVGEHIVDCALAVRLTEASRRGESLDGAALDLVREMRERDWRAGFVAVDRSGQWVARRTTASLSWCKVDETGTTGFWDETGASA